MTQPLPGHADQPTVDAWRGLSTDGAWAFHFVTGDGRVVASGDGYQTEEAMRRGILEAERYWPRYGNTGRVTETLLADGRS